MTIERLKSLNRAAMGSHGTWNLVKPSFKRVKGMAYGIITVLMTMIM